MKDLRKKCLSLLLLLFLLTASAFLSPDFSGAQGQGTKTEAETKVEEPQKAEESSQSEEERAPFNLEEVVVTGTRTRHLLKDVPVATSVITREELEASNVSNIEDVIRELPGITTTKSYFRELRATIRGLPSNQALVMIDGQRVRNQLGDGVDLNDIPIDMIERIEVVKGPASTLYGSEAMAGVINIITKSPPAKPLLNGRMALGTHHDGAHNFTAGGRYPLGVGKDIHHLGLFLSYNKNSWDGSHYNDWYDKHNLFGKLDYELARLGKLTLGTRWIREDREGNDRSQLMFNFNWDKQFSESSGLKIALDRNQHFGETVGREWPKSPKHKEYLTHGEVQYNQSIGKRNLITLGTEYRHDKLAESNTVNPKSTSTKSWFIQDEIKLFQPLTLLLGLRIDDHSQWGEAYNPKVNLLYQPTQDTRLRLSFGRGFKSPSMSELYRSETHTTYHLQGNPNLQPERSYGYSLGGEHSFFFGKGEEPQALLLGFTLFKNDMKNMIATRRAGIRSDRRRLFQYENTSQVRTQGIELEMKYAPFKSLEGSLAYTYLDTEDKERSKELEYRPHNTMTFTLKYDNKRYGLGGKLRWEYASRMYEYDSRGRTVKLDPTTRTYIKLTKDITKFAQAFVEMDNLFGNNYDEYQGSRWGSSPGQTFLIGINGKF